MDYLIFGVAWTICFAGADWATGRDWTHLGWPTRSIYAVAPPLMGLFLWAWHGPVPELLAPPWAWVVWLMHSGAAVPFGWALWRSVLGWSSFGGSMNPENEQELAREALRNAVSAAFPLTSLCFMGMPFGIALFAMVLFATWATVVAIWYGQETLKGHDVGPAVDALHGAGYGLIVAVACVGSHLPVFWPHG